MRDTFAKSKGCGGAGRTYGGAGRSSSKLVTYHDKQRLGL